MVMSPDWVVFASDATDVTTAVGTIATAVIAAVGLFYANRQLQEARKVAYGDFLLRLDEAFQRHNLAHQRLQPAFEWGFDAKSGRSKGGPTDPGDFLLVTEYMGLFERVYTLVESRMAQIEVIDSLYGYRVLNVVRNDIIRKAKLENPEVAKYWTRFIRLWRALKARHGDWPDFPEVCTFGG
jgi:hypothetical protein